MSIPPAAPSRLRGCVVIADVDATRKRDVSIDNQHLAVITLQPTLARCRIEQRMIGRDLDSVVLEGGDEGLCERQRPEPVDYHAHGHAGARSLTQRRRESTPGVVVGEDVRLEVHERSGARNRGQHGGEGLATVLENSDLVAGSQLVWLARVALEVRQPARDRLPGPPAPDLHPGTLARTRRGCNVCARFAP
jgi:hypothetical protein